ncbi:hypothetical protein F5Y16DRAFT_276577 [Xylariaceae sp. FL0255]|nr:hypothetical protein F5Y16DRAFT_276577 [Xylariaceae sp. FL0255]
MMSSLKKGDVLIPTPRGFIGIRVAQIVFSLIILGLAGYWIHGYNAGPLDFAIATSLFTWFVAGYAILSEHVPSCRGLYNTWAVLSLDFLMIIFWLATLGSNASFRSEFTTRVEGSCSDDGSLINAGHCDVEKRDAFATDFGLDILSAVAGISVIPLLLFVATFAYVAHFYRLEWAKHSTSRDAEKANTSTATPAVGPEQSQPFIGQQQQPQWAQQQQQYQGGYDTYSQNPVYTGGQASYAEAPAPHYDQQYHQQYNQQYHAHQ